VSVVDWQSARVKPLQVPSPYGYTGSSTLTDSLSPLSPHVIPSPAGSVSSVGSTVRTTHHLSHLGLVPTPTLPVNTLIRPPGMVVWKAFCFSRDVFFIF